MSSSSFKKCGDKSYSVVNHEREKKRTGIVTVTNDNINVKSSIVLADEV